MVYRDYRCIKCGFKIEVEVPITVSSEDIPELEFCPACKEERTLIREWQKIPHVGDKGKGRWQHS